jgi:acetyltransferase EpsM
MSFALVCWGSHARDIEAIANRADKSILAVYDDDEDVNAILPPDDLSGHVVFGINSATARRDMAARFPNATGAHPLVDPSAVVGFNCHLGRGVVLAPHATLLRDVILGEHCHVNFNACMTRCTIGRFTTISPNATVCGDVTIGEAVTIGAGAVVSDRCTIGDECIIAAGAILPPLSEVPDGTTAIGVWRNAKSH